jgi:dihydroorotate dehydrogenase electron transfer subunit
MNQPFFKITIVIGGSMILTETIDTMQCLAEGVYRMRISSERLANSSKPGQFVNVVCSDSFKSWLRRPISICNVDKDTHKVDIVFQVKGNGTEQLSMFKKGDAIDLMGPLGNPFDTELHGGNIAVIGGGIGTFPLLYLLKSLQGNHRTAFLGFRNGSSIVMKDEFSSSCEELQIATDDGSEGHHGFVTDLFLNEIKEGSFQRVYACGPLIMMKKVVDICISHQIPVQVSMEQRMGCGVGACLVCACKKKVGDDFTYTHVCKEGPVFWGQEIDFE